MDPEGAVLVPVMLLDAWEWSSSSRYNRLGLLHQSSGPAAAAGVDRENYHSWFSSPWPYFFLCHSLVFIHSDRPLKVFLDPLGYKAIFPTVMLQDSICSVS